MVIITLQTYLFTNEFFQLIKIWQVELYLFSVDIFIIFKLMLGKLLGI